MLGVSGLSRLAVGGALLVASTLSALAQDADLNKARRLLFQNMERIVTRNVVAVVVFRDPTMRGREQQIKLTESPEGTSRRTILQPLSMQGVETVDDGRQAATFLPDRRELIVQDSPRRQACNAEFRMRLLDRNYQLRLVSARRVAGRPAVTVVAVPRTEDLDIRRFTFDAETGFLLRMETERPGESPVVRLEVQVVSYPAELPRETFDLKPVGGVRRVRYRSPEPFKPRENSPIEGLNPIVPRRLPSGFRVEEVQVLDPEKRMVAVRITDGLVRGTVYQRPAGGESRPPMPGASVLETANVRLVLMVDAGPKVRERLLQAFAQSANRRASGEIEGLWTFLPAFSELLLAPIALSSLEVRVEDGELRIVVPVLDRPQGPTTGTR